jgi:AcrR family transcriptional regulator
MSAKRVYEPQPWQLPSGRHGLSPEAVALSQRDRLLEAMARVSAAKGYQATSVADVIKRAGVSRATFYEMFDDKEACFLAAYDMVLDALFAETLDSLEEIEDGPERLRVMLGAAFERFAADPELTRMVSFESMGGGLVVRGRYLSVVWRFAAEISKVIERDGVGGDGPEGLALILAGGLGYLVSEEVARGRTTELPRLVPELVFASLRPLYGDKIATKEMQKARETKVYTSR